MAGEQEKYVKLNTDKVKQLSKFKIDYSKVHVLEYVDKEKKLPSTFREFISALPRAPIQTQAVPRPTFPPDLKYLQSYSTTYYPKGKMAIAVNWDLHPQIKASLDQYITDLSNDGYYATAYKVKGGSPQEFRTFLKNNLPLAGALLVGNLPVAWFEMDDDFFGAHAEFPCDLYYMDLNGSWTDTDSDGKFSGHPTNVQPEIWVARLWTPTLMGNDPVLIRDYFSRNHQYRLGLMGYSRSALAYVDDDWTGFGDCAFDLMMPAPSIEVITDPATTDADRYKAEINHHRGWAQVCAHSSPSGHSFKIPGGAEWVPNTYLKDVNPPNAYFYNLFACSNARFTDADYMAGWYIFRKSGGAKCNGLVAVGSTKTGSMQFFENFYSPMGAGKAVGEAYKDWWNALGTDHNLDERQWYYGMTLLGDPTINWWSGAVPVLQNPGDGETFDHYPRKTNFLWDPINIPGVAYTVEVDYHYGKWASEDNNGRGQIISNLTTNTYEHEFVGKQRGRWRVRAKVGGIDFPWSPWRYFTYTV